MKLAAVSTRPAERTILALNPATGSTTSSETLGATDLQEAVARHCAALPSA
jgi:hypothetical protein